MVSIVLTMIILSPLAVQHSWESGMADPKTKHAFPNILSQSNLPHSCFCMQVCLDYCC